VDRSANRAIAGLEYAGLHSQGGNGATIHTRLSTKVYKTAGWAALSYLGANFPVDASCFVLT
jgi:hypothetical protein